MKKVTFKCKCKRKRCVFYSNLKKGCYKEIDNICLDNKKQKTKKAVK